MPDRQPQRVAHNVEQTITRVDAQPVAQTLRGRLWRTAFCQLGFGFIGSTHSNTRAARPRLLPPEVVAKKNLTFLSPGSKNGATNTAEGDLLYRSHGEATRFDAAVNGTYPHQMHYGAGVVLQCRHG